MEIDCSDWHFCNLCRSESYILDVFPNNHWGYTAFKTRSKHRFVQHESSTEHMTHFQKYYCESCDTQCYSQFELNKHCDTIKHKRNNNITMNCDVCKYSTTERTKLERHFQTLKHKNAVNGIQKKEGDYICEACNFKSKTESKFKAHGESKKHQTAVNGIQKKDSLWYCDLCGFDAKCNSQMKVHQNSKKHQYAVSRVVNLNTPEEVKVLQ